MIQLVVFAFVAVVAIGLFVYQAQQEKQRRLDWMTLAPTLGLRYHGEEPLSDFYPSFKVFSVGRGRRARNLLRGESGRIRVLLGDYQYTTGSGKSSTTHRHTVCILERDGLDLPRCYMRPQNLLDAVGKLFGGQDIDFEDDPVFSKAYVLQGTNVAGIRRRFDRPSRAWLASHSSMLLRFEASGSTIVFLGPQLEPALAPRFLDDALNFLMLWSEPVAGGRPKLEA